MLNVNTSGLHQREPERRKLSYSCAAAIFSLGVYERWKNTSTGYD